MVPILSQKLLATALTKKPDNGISHMDEIFLGTTNEKRDFCVLGNSKSQSHSSTLEDDL